MGEIVRDKPPAENDEVDCPDCSGTGYVTCEFCDGSGKVDSGYAQAVLDYEKHIQDKVAEKVAERRVTEGYQRD